MDKLKEYSKKRDFSKTSEPKGEHKKTGSKKTMFVIQKHAARRTHYDFRIEVDGVLKSWAVPKEPSMSTKDRRLAVQTEDHPMEYGSFEGTIPKGEYGGGNVEIWDRGFFVNMTIKYGKLEPLSKWIDKGHFIIWVKGDRLRGGFALNRMKDGKNWIMIKMNDEEAIENKKDEQTPSKFASVNGKEIEITNSKKEVFANISKEDFVDYYRAAAPLMLEHIKGRPISMFRMPHGMREEGFFQKHVPDYFPSWMGRAEVMHKGKKITYIMANDEESIVYLATQVVIPHILPSRIDKIDYPDKMIFDLDPSVNDVKMTQQVALDVKKFLDQVRMPSHVMTSGNKGYHIVIPLDRSTKQEDVKNFASKMAQVLANHYPDTMTNEMRIEKRGDRVMIDVVRNSPAHTAVAPYSVRASLRGGIAMPIEWGEIKKIGPHHFTLDNVHERLKKGDIWKGMYDEGVSISRIQKQLKK
jgi:bifunctional non-homologous end joining protein LigD